MNGMIILLSAAANITIGKYISIKSRDFNWLTQFAISVKGVMVVHSCGGFDRDV